MPTTYIVCAANARSVCDS